MHMLAGVMLTLKYVATVIKMRDNLFGNTSYEALASLYVVKGFNVIAKTCVNSFRNITTPVLQIRRGHYISLSCALPQSRSGITR